MSLISVDTLQHSLTFYTFDAPTRKGFFNSQQQNHDHDQVICRTLWALLFHDLYIFKRRLASAALLETTFAFSLLSRIGSVQFSAFWFYSIIFFQPFENSSAFCSFAILIISCLFLLHWGCIGNASGMHWGCIGNTLETHWKRFWDAFETYWGCIRNALETHLTIFCRLLHLRRFNCYFKSWKT